MTFTLLHSMSALLWWLSGKESACIAGDLGLIPGWGRPPWRRECQPTLLFFSRKSHEQRSLVGYSPWDCKRVEHGEGNGNPLQYSCLENTMDRGAWQATVHEVTKSRIRLSDFTFT